MPMKSYEARIPNALDKIRAQENVTDYFPECLENFEIVKHFRLTF